MTTSPARELYDRITAQPKPTWMKRLAAELAAHEPPWRVFCVQCRQEWDAGRNTWCSGFYGFRRPEVIDQWIAEHKRYVGHEDVELVDGPSEVDAK